MTEIHHSDYTLGSRFWLQTDSTKFAESVTSAQNDLKIDFATSENIAEMTRVMADASIQKFLSAENKAFANEAIGRAEIFAASHFASEDEKTAELNTAEKNAVSLGIDMEIIKDELQGMVENLSNSTKEKWFPQGDKGAKFVETAMKKVLASTEWSDRAQLGKLSDVGKMSLMNEIAGVTEMLVKNKISENAVLYLLNGKLLDLTNSGDLLKSVVDDAQAARKQFIDEDNIRAAVNQVKEQIQAYIDKGGDTSKIAQLKDNLAKLEKFAETVISQRKEMSELLDVSQRQVDTTGKMDKASFQEAQLKDVKNRMRAFRFELETASGKKMGFMEKMRRKLDNFKNTKWAAFKASVKNIFGSGINIFNAFKEARRMWKEGPLIPLGKLKHITADDYNSMKLNTMQLNSMISGLQWNMPGYNLRGKELMGSAERTDVSLDKAIANATDMTHKSNTAIRYYFSGVEQKAKAKAAEVHEKLDPIVMKGGERKAKMSIGVDFIAGLGVGKAVTAQFRAGVSFKTNATLTVPPGGGKLHAVYEVALEGHVGADANVGAISDDGNGNGLGAQVKAKIGGGNKMTLEKTYDNVDQFLAETKGTDLFMEDSSLGVLFHHAGTAIRKAGEWVNNTVLGEKGLGFKIDHKKFDEIAYTERKRELHTFSRMDGLVSKKMNAFYRSSGESVSSFIEGEASARAGVYKMGPKDDAPTSKLSFGGSVKGSIEYESARQFTFYRKLSEAYHFHTADGMQKAASDELEGLRSGGKFGNKLFVSDAETFVDLATKARTKNEIATAMTNILTRFEDMEAKANKNAPSSEGDVKTQFWDTFAHSARLAALSTLALQKRAGELPEADRKELESVLEATNNYLMERLTNPRVAIPADIYMDTLAQSYKVDSPDQIITSGTIEVDVTTPDFALGEKDLPYQLSEADQYKAEFGLSMKSYANSLVDVVGTSPVNTVKNQIIGAKPKLQIGFKDKSPSTTNPDVRPHKNMSSTTLEVKIGVNMPLRMVLDAIAKAYVKKYGSGGKTDQADIEEQILNDLVFDGTMAGLQAGASTVTSLLDTPIKLLAMNSPVFAKMVGKISDAATEVGKFMAKNITDFGWDYDYEKTIQWQFDNGRFTSFNIASTVNDSFKLSAKLAGPLQINLAASLETSTNDHNVYPRPSVDSMLNKIPDLVSTGDTNIVNHFATINKKGLLRLMDAFSAPADKEVAGDKYFQQDRECFQERLEQARQIIDRVSQSTAAVGTEAKGLKQVLDGLLTAIKSHDEKTPEQQRLDACVSLFTTLNAAFNLAVQCPEPQVAA